MDGLAAVLFVFGIICLMLVLISVAVGYLNAEQNGYWDAMDGNRDHDYYDGREQKAYERGRTRRLEVEAKAEYLQTKAKERNDSRNR